MKTTGQQARGDAELVELYLPACRHLSRQRHRDELADQRRILGASNFYWVWATRPRGVKMARTIATMPNAGMSPIR
jgi:hypothetical protein